jgi:hypothetical protein
VELTVKRTPDTETDGPDEIIADDEPTRKSAEYPESVVTTVSDI